MGFRVFLLVLLSIWWPGGRLDAADPTKCTSHHYKSSIGQPMQFCLGRGFLFAKGVIGQNTSKSFEMALSGSTKIKAVFLQSGGGRAGEGVRMGAMIRERKLNTAINGVCASSCLLAYLGGVERFKTKSAKLGFHRAAPVDDLSPEETNEILQTILPQFKEYFTLMGANPEAIGIAWKRSIFDMYWYSRRELNTWKITTRFEPRLPAPPRQSSDATAGVLAGFRMSCSLMGAFVKSWNKENAKKWLDRSTQSLWATANCAENRIRFRYRVKANKRQLSKRLQAKAARSTFCKSDFLREQMKFGWQIWFHVDFRNKKRRAIIVSCR